VAERTLNYLHTGSAKVLATRVMQPLWTSQALLDHGLPAISPVVVRLTSATMTIRGEKWPYDPTATEPYLASKRSHTITYGESLYRVCGIYLPLLLPMLIKRLLFQHFVAHFQIVMCLVDRPSPMPFIDQAGEDHRVAYTIAWITLKAFIYDCVNLVSAAVNKRIDKQSHSNDPLLISEAKELKQKLKTWSKLSEPLSYGRHGTHSNSTMQLLIHLVAPRDQLQFGLPSPSPSLRSISYSDFARSLFNMGKIDSPISIRCPINPQGFTPALLRLAVHHIGRNIPSDHQETFVTHVLQSCAQRMHIQFIPWSKQTTGQRGRSSVKPMHDCWVMLGKDPLSISASGSQPNQVLTANDAARAGANFMNTNDRNAPWSTDIPLNELRVILSKSCLPAQWSLQSASLSKVEPYIKETYEYVHDNYHGDIWWHKMALLFAILFSRIIPRIAAPDEEIQAIKKSKNSSNLTQMVRSLSWVNNPSERRGVLDKTPFITMMSTYVIALLDEQSPLRLYMANHKNALGRAWSTKHGKHIF